MKSLFPFLFCLVITLLFLGCNRDPDAYVSVLTEAETTGAPTTEAGETEPPHTDESLSDAESPLVLISLSESVSRGSNATITVKGLPGITYSIEVRYSSGISSAKGLEPKAADKNGLVSWTWRVGSKTKLGAYPITVRGNDRSAVFPFTVTE